MERRYGHSNKFTNEIKTIKSWFLTGVGSDVATLRRVWLDTPHGTYVYALQLLSFSKAFKIMEETSVDVANFYDRGTSPDEKYEILHRYVSRDRRRGSQLPSATTQSMFLVNAALHSDGFEPYAQSTMEHFIGIGN